jgi:hypothetical protein
MRVEEIEIFVDDRIGRPYRSVGPISARVTSGAGWNKARTIEDVNSKLREEALRMGQAQSSTSRTPEVSLRLPGRPSTLRASQ